MDTFPIRRRIADFLLYDDAGQPASRFAPARPYELTKAQRSEIAPTIGLQAPLDSDFLAGVQHDEPGATLLRCIAMKRCVVEGLHHSMPRRLGPQSRAEIPTRNVPRSAGVQAHGALNTAARAESAEVVFYRLLQETRFHMAGTLGRDPQ